jgi:murein DD-endopeptidase MepM/ murein hydrolase activator NlpD
MRLVRGAVLGALTTAVVLCSTSPAFALAGEPGGASAPAAEQSGGSEFGVPASITRPVVSELRVPASALPGRPPKVTLRILEKGVGTVYMRVLITNLATHKMPVTATMGWVHTSRLLTVAWPSHASLAAGNYQVTISAHDHHNGNLLRSAHSSGEATLTVKAAPAPPAPTPTMPIASPEAGVPTPAQTVADGAVFPVQGTHNFGGPENRYGAPRSGHIHQGQDILTAEGTPDVAPLSGTIVSTSFQAGAAGYYLVEHTSIGFDFMFAHCEANSFEVAENQTVTPGQALCKAGQTGDATTPHLHFEMWVGGWQASGGHPIDPLPYLEAWEHGA